MTMSFLQHPPPLAGVICHAGDASDIPQHSPAGSGSLSYAQGFPPVTSLPLGAGGIAPRREDFNAVLKLLSAHAYYRQSGGPAIWSPGLDYAERCEVYGSDGKKYVAQQASGPSIPLVGAKDPAQGDEAFWKRWDREIAAAPDATSTVKGVSRFATADEAAKGTRDDVAVTPAGLEARLACRVTEFKSWYEKYPPPGWAIRNGGVLLNAPRHYPALWAALHQPENAWKLITEDEWQAMSAAAPWNGIGGAPYFVLDAAAGTVRLPDTRGMYAEDAGFDGLDVGGVHGDAIRNIHGELNTPADRAAELLGDKVAASGVFDLFGKGTKWGIANVDNTSLGQSKMVFDAGRVVPVANKNQPRAFGILPCVYIGDKQ